MTEHPKEPCGNAGGSQSLRVYPSRDHRTRLDIGFERDK
jgi:hypothetical protein